MTNMAPEQTPQVEIEVDRSLALRFASDPGLCRKIGASLVALGLAQTGFTLAGIDHFDSSKSPSTMAESTVRGELLGPPFDNPKAYRPTIHHARVKETPEPVPSSISPAIIVPPPHKTVVVKPAKPHKAVSHRVPLRPAITARPAFRRSTQQQPLKDVSWPKNNCQAAIPEGTYGIVGVNHGKPFTQNNCLLHETSEFKDFALYVNPNNPGEKDPYSYGFRAGKYAVWYAAKAGVYRRSWMLDVEGKKYFSKDQRANVQVLQGEMDGIRAGAKQRRLVVPRFMIYSATVPGSSAGMYEAITGGWKNHLPAWVAAGECDEGYDFTGGGVVMVQHVVNGLDTDTLCPGYTLRDVL
ncbi:MAG TPA: hypothetical protein VLG13_01910 [Patescibacteria group bacterium]|nr:hypothetical protein [Patescibacteria group bacterium]